ncbi:hypothetical protein HDE_09100 [Halotydeus destructor]|nr:hypothetical protein HDE_09100 [Halotydeus destructor]
MVNFCLNQTRIFLYAKVNTNGIEVANELYKYFVPILVIGSFASVFINAGLFVIGHRFTRNKSPVLLLSLNLASTDTVASLLMGLSLILNSLLPVVFKVQFPRCPFVVLELFRTTALIASVLHLLALAYLHYKGTINPLHYRSLSVCSLDSVTSSIHMITAFCWSLPLVIFTLYLYSVPCQAFQTESCDIEFLVFKEYRLLVLTCFLTPLILMAILYLIVFNHIRNRSNQQNGLMASPPGGQRATKVCLEPPCSCFRFLKRPLMADTVVRVTCPQRGASVDTLSTGTGTRPGTGSASSKSNGKALSTTLIILGTYLICWMPAVTFLALTCQDGCPYPILNIDPVTKVTLSFIINGLVCLKSLVDPFIYTFRMKEVRLALKKSLSRSRHRRSLYRSTISGQTARRRMTNERSS